MMHALLSHCMQAFSASLEKVILFQQLHAKTLATAQREIFLLVIVVVPAMGNCVVAATFLALEMWLNVCLQTKMKYSKRLSDPRTCI